MNLGFLDDLVSYANTASLFIKALMKGLLSLVALAPTVAEFIREGVEKWFDIFEQKKSERVDDSVIEELKAKAHSDVVASTMAKFHGSGSLISKSVIEAMIKLFVEIIKAKRYGENIERNEKAVLKGYISTSEDIQNAEKTHSALKLFGA